ncbi:MAG: LPS export ABC transporter periplasmic protein LptC [Candidatus Marinimicrobia bacterium]|nr:LPS export ABC transporter periplasmic protein LptC [Candidatus Neomarinimicrobiota bacterium]
MIKKPRHFRNLVFIFLVALLLAACTKTGDYSTFPDGRVPDREIWNAVITVTRSGETESRIFAAHIVQYPNSNDMIISDSMRIDFYRDGLHESYLIADSGLVNDKSDNIVAIGNVIMVSDSGFTAYTDSVFFINDSNKVYTNSAIQIFSKEDTLYGTDFVSDTKFENWTIFNPLGKTIREFDK